MKSWFALVLSVALLLSGGHAHAFKISPFKTSMEPIPQASQVYRIENNSDESIAVQISVQNWEITPDGTEINTDAEDEFAVFPAQVVLKPRESRGVRIQWLGDAAPAQERAYRVLAEQIPANLAGVPDEGARLKFLLRFKAGLYMTPEDAQGADIRVVDTAVQGDTLRLTLQNNGASHVLMRNPVLTLQMADGHNRIITGEVAAPLHDANMHAGARRYFDIILPAGDAAGVRGASLTFDSGF